MKKISIAIDGPAAGGKSTVARRIAQELDYLYVDTGAMYRAVTWLALKRGIAVDDQEGVAALAREMNFRMEPDWSAYAGYHVYVDGAEITGELHSPAVNDSVSPVSRISGVRRMLVELQKEMGRSGGVVMAGRDICTVVLPDAQLKIFLTASEAERARRRFEELKELGTPQPREEVEGVIRSRDTIDSSREDSPLRIAPGAVVVDTTDLSVDDVVAHIIALARERMRVS